MSQHIYTYDPANDQLTEIGGAGHIIKDETGAVFTKRENLQFDGMKVSDDATNNATIVAAIETNFVGTWAQWQALTLAERAQYKTVDLTDDFNGAPISNSNLLDNPWFTVNQRGATSVTTTWTYFVDRWRTGNNAYNLVINNDKTITFKAGGITEINQAIEYDRFNLGKVYTLSVMLSDDTIRSVSGVIEQKSQWTRLFAVKLSDTDDIWAAIDVDQIYIAASIFVNTDLTADLTIKAMKLELGSVSTLAQDTAPNYTEELLKCQRYFFRRTNNGGGIIGSGYAHTTTSARIAVTTPVTMRTTPSVTISDDGASSLAILSNGARLIPSDVSVLIARENVVTLNLTASGLTQSQTVCVRDISASNIDFSADL